MISIKSLGTTVAIIFISGKTGGSLAVFVHKTLTYSVRHGLSISNGDVEALCIDIFKEKNKNIFIITIYRQIAGMYEFESYFKSFLKKTKYNITYIINK